MQLKKRQEKREYITKKKYRPTKKVQEWDQFKQGISPKAKKKKHSHDLRSIAEWQMVTGRIDIDGM